MSICLSALRTYKMHALRTTTREIPLAATVAQRYLKQGLRPFTTKILSHPLKEASSLGPLLEEIVEKDFPTHPFTQLTQIGKVKKVLPRYTAMSEAFPYIQAGAYKNLILRCIESNKGVAKEVEKTFVVGAFLSFDETGGLYGLRTQGISYLPRILETRNFHVSLLKADVERIFGDQVLPEYDAATKIYLKDLMSDLGAFDAVHRCAAMVAFEMHAAQMIDALWGALARVYPGIDKESLAYFRLHVGGDDPQEVYHEQLTKKLTSSVVPKERQEDFLQKFKSCYASNVAWCAEISER